MEDNNVGGFLKMDLALEFDNLRINDNFNVLSN